MGNVTPQRRQVNLRWHQAQVTRRHKTLWSVSQHVGKKSSLDGCSCRLIFTTLRRWRLMRNRRRRGHARGLPLEPHGFAASWSPRSRLSRTFVQSRHPHLCGTPKYRFRTDLLGRPERGAPIEDDMVEPAPGWQAALKMVGTPYQRLCRLASPAAAVVALRSCFGMKGYVSRA